MPHLRPFLAARVLSVAGLQTGLVATAAHVFSQTGSALALALMMLGVTLAVAVAAPLAGALADRIAPRRVMLQSELGSAVLSLFGAAVPAVGPLIAAHVARAVVDAPFRPAGMLLFTSADEAQTRRTIGAWSAADRIGMIVGPPLGGLLYGVAGIRAALLANAVLSVLAIACIIAARVPGGERRPRAAARGDERSTDGLRILWADGRLRSALWTLCAAAGAVGAIGVAHQPYVADVGAAPALYGVLLGGWSVGALAAGWCFARRPGASLTTSARVGAAGMAVLVAIAFRPPIEVTVGLVAVAGLLFSTTAMASDTIIARHAPERLRGRVVAAQLSAVQIAASLGFLAGGLLVEAVGPAAVYAVAGTVALSGALGGMIPRGLAVARATTRSVPA